MMESLPILHLQFFFFNKKKVRFGSKEWHCLLMKFKNFNQESSAGCGSDAAIKHFSREKKIEDTNS